MKGGAGRLALLLSGRGSNLGAFLRAQQAGELQGSVEVVISNRPEAAGLKIAQDAGIATAVVDHTLYESREAFDEVLAEKISGFKPDVIVLAGFMRILTTNFVDRFRGQLINIHPSLLPKYRGLNTHQRALDAGEREGGATVHFVTADLDEGPGILQTPVSIEEGDTAVTLASRVLPFEHQLYPHAANLVLTGQVSLSKHGAVWNDEILPPGGKIWRPNCQ
ncbi:MAG: phosphoribosylglycinamide formyltransferase [Halieaceae bacterium]|jgi:phosphoribosylglycinamide formyltransferase-1|nr:phosphoribosylglycinamide formyltransferase [marine gamma proteobacterium HTCC2080]MBT3458686.1 phosphoribosylglycinamide formyltransferase [Halieaceae bacterium]MBT4854480.1 phosphoribosylglycinamide formyltransferase [Halieaceae bacterium]MBT5210149.1 phosphoribosylglycinamide formyltransferase [Halieaceae bacterium]MBT6332869.1 phosphoribosylglycinamide formyltransferase [Halieaceae bacterium]